MIAFLRVVGMVNAAAWFGSAFFFVLLAPAALNSAAMQALLGSRFHEYYSRAIGYVVGQHYFWWHLVFGLIALGHLGAEFVYLGKRPRRFWLGLLAFSLAAGLVSQHALLPRLARLHGSVHGINSAPEQREAARHSRAIWTGVERTLEVTMLLGLALYFWRTTNPPIVARFVPSAKIRG